MSDPKDNVQPKDVLHKPDVECNPSLLKDSGSFGKNGSSSGDLREHRDTLNAMKPPSSAADLKLPAPELLITPETAAVIRDKRLADHTLTDKQVDAKNETGRAAFLDAVANSKQVDGRISAAEMRTALGERVNGPYRQMSAAEKFAAWVKAKLQDIE